MVLLICNNVRIYWYGIENSTFITIIRSFKAVVLNFFGITDDTPRVWVLYFVFNSIRVMP